jgi:predicted nucleic acid-binding protein
MSENHIFVDTNVLIGYFIKQQKDVAALNYIFSLKGKRLYTSSLSIAQVISVLQKNQTNDTIKEFAAYLMSKFNIISFVEEDVKTALKLKGTDIEDNIQYALSKKLKCYWFITNNVKDYTSFLDVDVLLPAKVRKILK